MTSNRTGRRPRPLPRGNSLFTPDATESRRELEHRSATFLLWLHQLPVWLPPVLAAGLLLAGLAVGGVGGAIALGGLAIVLGWLAALSWPRLSAQSRLLRIMLIGAVLTVAIVRGLHL